MAYVKCNYIGCNQFYSGNKVLKCGKCKIALYCNRKCFQKDLPEHKKTCCDVELKNLHTHLNCESKLKQDYTNLEVYIVTCKTYYEEPPKVEESKLTKKSVYIRIDTYDISSAMFSRNTEYIEKMIPGYQEIYDNIETEDYLIIYIQDTNSKKVSVYLA
jgi:hypothetical protein